MYLVPNGVKCHAESQIGNPRVADLTLGMADVSKVGGGGSRGFLPNVNGTMARKNGTIQTAP